MSLRGRNGMRGQERGPLMMMKGPLFLLISNVWGVWGQKGGGPTNDDEGFLVSADFKCFRKGMWGQEGAY